MGEKHGKKAKKIVPKSFVLYTLYDTGVNEVDSPINLIIPMALLDERGRGWDIFSLTRSA